MHKPVLVFMVGACLCSQSVFASNFGADRHAKLGVSCVVCHGPDEKNPKLPGIEECEQCHNVKALVEKTKHVKPKNPHTSPHYQDRLDCNNCHMMHEPPQNFCQQCHNFDYKVP